MAYIAAIDEGTTGTRAVLYDLDKNKIIASKSSEIKQFYPKPSYVEENANEIYAETLASLVEVLERRGQIAFHRHIHGDITIHLLCPFLFSSCQKADKMVKYNIPICES